MFSGIFLSVLSCIAMRFGICVPDMVQMWNMQISKSFFKRKQLLLRFKIYDILQQENALMRTITATAIRDTESNVLGSYFMFHAIVRINKMGGKAKRR